MLIAWIFSIELHFIYYSAVTGKILTLHRTFVQIRFEIASADEFTHFARVRFKRVFTRKERFFTSFSADLKTQSVCLVCTKLFV